jgi:HPt (histidine-containing phosphotransfer) domain-containing protein
MVRSMSVIDLPQYSRKAYTIQQEIARLWKTYPRLRATDAILYQQLATVPPAALPALAKRLAAETTPRAALFGFAAFGRSFRGPAFAPPHEAVKALAAAQLPALAALATRLETR